MATKTKLGRMCKDKMVSELSNEISKHPDFVLTNYMGCTVTRMNEMRRNLNKVSSKYLVIKNSLLRVVLKEKKLADLVSQVDGGMGISLSSKDIIATCKILATFAKENDKFRIKAAVIDGKIVTADDVKFLASLPPRDVLLAQVVGGIKAPITGFVCTLSGILRKFVLVVSAIKDRPVKPPEQPKESVPPATQ